MIEYEDGTTVEVPMVNKRVLLIDGTNFLHRAFHFAKQAKQQKSSSHSMLEQIKGDEEAPKMLDTVSEELKKERTFHNFFSIIAFYAKHHKADDVIITLDVSKSWRYHYANSDQSHTSKIYKGNRNKYMTEEDIVNYEQFKRICADIKDFMVNHTNIKLVFNDNLEADDIIAGFTQFIPNHHYIVVSADQDLTQLISSNVTVIDPKTNSPRVCDDVEYFMFKKCIRGDIGDNVMSAFPKVRETRIVKAYEDAFERENMMNHIWKDVNGTEHRVRDIFEENMVMMNLTKQPSHIREIIQTTVEGAFKAPIIQVRSANVIWKLGQMKIASLAEVISKYKDQYFWLF